MLCRCPYAPAGSDFNIATYYLSDSRLKTPNCSGRITAFFRIIASAEKGGEAKLVQWGTIRGRIFTRGGGRQVLFFWAGL